MKLYGVFGKGSGKVGNSVWAISGGEQIVRPYNPNVSNPNTDAQVAQRAKLKLMSQLGAALAPALGFAKQGLVSARNQFVSKNIGLATYAGQKAEVAVDDLQLTPSNVGFPAITVDPDFEVHLNSAAAADIKRVAYFVYRRTTEEQLEYVASAIVTEPGANRTFPHSFGLSNGEWVVYAYGIKDNSTAATMRYENYVTTAGANEAELSVIELFRTADYALTKTSAAFTNQ